MNKSSIYLKRALKNIINLEEGEKFKLKDLFLGYEWKRLSKELRINLGKEFYRYITSQDNEYPIRFLEKTKSNKSIYGVIKGDFQASNNYDYEEDDDYEDDLYD